MTRALQIRFFDQAKKINKSNQPHFKNDVSYKITPHAMNAEKAKIACLDI